MMDLKQIGLVVVAGALAFSGCQKEHPTGIEHVIVIGLDGMSAQGMLEANTPCMDSLMLNGAYSFSSRSINPTTSLPNWNAMVCGAGPEQTGVANNEWKRSIDQYSIVAMSENHVFPNIFRVIREQMPDAETGAIYDWGGFQDMLETEVISTYKTCKGQHETALQSAEYIKEKKPAFLFIQLDKIDSYGHEYAHMTPTYIKGIEEADKDVRVIVDAVKQANIADRTLIIVVSDHGGVFFAHGGYMYEEHATPIIYCGAGVKKNYRIKQTINRFDLAADVAFAFGLKQPYVWTGRPVKPAFEGFDEPEGLDVGFQVLPSPIFMTPVPSLRYGEVVYDRDAEVVIRKPIGYEGEIYYTIDGSEPTKQSTMYTGPFKLSTSALVKAKLINDTAESNAQYGYYRVCRSSEGHGLRYTIYHQPGRKSLSETAGRKVLTSGICYEPTITPQAFADFKNEVEKVMLEECPTDHGITMDGWIEIDKDDRYTFKIWSRGLFDMQIDGKSLFQHHTMNYGSGLFGEIDLTKGLHSFHFEVFRDREIPDTQIYIERDEEAGQLIPGNKLFLQKK